MHAQKLQRPSLYWIVLVYVVLLVAATLGLLFKLDALIEIVVRYGIGGGRAGVVAALLTATTGVFALPYLLRMAVSPLMRIASFVCSFVAIAGWLLGAWWVEVNMGRSMGLLPILLAHSGLLLALASVWVIGLPVWPLKKRR